MRVLINNGQGPQDYTKYVMDGTLTLEDSINVPTLITFLLCPTDNTFIVPRRSSYVTIVSDVLAPSGGYGSGKILATGFITEEPERSFLGLGATSGPYKFIKYSYSINVTSDEWLLNCKTVPYIPAFVNQTDSQILAAIAQALAPGFYDTTSLMATGTLIPYYAYDPTQTWSDIAKTFADQNRYHYKVVNRQILYQPFGDQPLGISYDENVQKESQINPTELLTHVVSVPPVNDCTVLGDTEPQTNWENYFCGDGFTSNFPLRHQVFDGTTVEVLKDDWSESELTTGTWIENDPQGVITLVDGDGNALGALNVVQKGVTGVYTPQVNATYLQAQNGLELGGGINLQHGQVTFNDACNGLIGCLYPSSTFVPGNVIAGFAITGQPGLGNFNCFSAQRFANTNQVILTVDMGYDITTVLRIGYVVVGSAFAGATYMNGNKFQITTIYNQGRSDAPTAYSVVLIGLTTYSTDQTNIETGTITVNKNDVFLTASGAGGVVIQPLFSGALVGQPVVTIANHQYVLQTWIGAGAATRYTRPYTNLINSVTYGAQNLAASGTVTWVITDYDLGQYVIEQQNPLFGLFPAAPPPVVTKYSTFNASLPPFAVYCLLNGINLNVSINYTDISLPPQGYLTVQSLTGASGGNLPWLPSQLSPPIHYQMGFGMINQTAQISQSGEVNELSFYTDDIPSVGARIVFQSWAYGQSVARVQDPIAIANEAAISGDDGVRSAIMTNLSPLPRTSDECEAAAAAAILDREYPQFQGTYSVESIPGRFENLYAPSLYPYPMTGRFLYINAPTRAVTGQNFFVNTVRIQIVELRAEVMSISLDYGPDLYLEKLLPSFLEREQNLLVPQQTSPPPNPITLPEVLNAYLPTLDNAHIILISNSLTGNYIQVDLGALPASACEVRNVDNGWGVANQGRIGLFTTQQFTLPRTARDQTWYLRTLNGDLYSRFSKALRVVYPLVPSSPSIVQSNAQQIVVGFAGDVRDIYGLELRALAASGISGSYFIQLPTNNTNPICNAEAFDREVVGTWYNVSFVDTYVGVAKTNVRNQLSPGGFGVAKPNYQIGDIIYLTCPTDSSFASLRVVAATGQIATILTVTPQYYTFDYGNPFPDKVGPSAGIVGTAQLISRNGYALVISGSLVNGVATIKTSTPHNLQVGQAVVIGAAYNATPTFITPYSHSLQDASVFSTVNQVSNVIDSTTFQYLDGINNQGGVNNVALVGLCAGMPLNFNIGNYFIPGAPPGTILQRPVFAPSDLVIDLNQADIQATLKYLESLTPGSRVGGLSVYFFNLTWDYSAPTTVPAFVAPSISGVFVDFNSQTLQWSLAEGIPDGHRVETYDVTLGTVLSRYTIDHPSNPQLLTRADIPAADWLSPRIFKVTPFDALGDGRPTFISWGGSSGTGVIGGGGGSLPTGQGCFISSAQSWMKGLSQGASQVLQAGWVQVGNQGFTSGGSNDDSYIYCYRIQVDVQITIAKMSYYITNNSGSFPAGVTGYLNFGIYSIDGNTKLIDGGAQSYNSSSTSPLLVTVTLGTPVTLAPGAYWFVYAFPTVNGSGVFQGDSMFLVGINGGTTFSNTGTPLGGGSEGSTPSVSLFKLLNNGPYMRFAITASGKVSAPGGVYSGLPSSLGTLSAPSTSFGVHGTAAIYGIPEVIFES